MANNKFTVPEVPGSKRTSPREYTHAVIGVYNWAARLQRDDVDIKQDGENWDYYAMCVATGEGNKYKASNTMWITVTADMFSKYNAIVTAHPTREAYIAHLRAERVKFCQTRLQGPEVIEVLRWSQSYANACKGHGEFSSYKSIRVVPTVKL